MWSVTTSNRRRDRGQSLGLSSRTISATGLTRPEVVVARVASLKYVVSITAFSSVCTEHATVSCSVISLSLVLASSSGWLCLCYIVDAFPNCIIPGPTPFYPQIKIKGVQIKIKGLQIKMSPYFNFMSRDFNLKSSYFNLNSFYFNLRVKRCSLWWCS